MSKDYTTYIIYVLDESGSMYGLSNATRSAFNEYIDDLKRGIEGKARLTLCKFSYRANTVYENVPLDDVEALTEENYVPNGGTALYDAIGEGVNLVKKKMTDDDRAICVIHTDGQENSSREMDLSSTKNLISSLEKQENWTFIYLGSDASTWDEASNIGISQGNVGMYASNVTGMSATSYSLAEITKDYSARSRGNLRSATRFADAGVSLDDKGFIPDAPKKDKRSSK